MPRFDRTGPSGAGPMTGGGWGFCNPSARAYAGFAYGPGRGVRGGYGRNYRGYKGFRRGCGWQGDYPYPAGRNMPYYSFPYDSPYAMKPEDEANMLRSEMDAIKKRLDELESLSPES